MVEFTNLGICEEEDRVLVVNTSHHVQALEIIVERAVVIAS